MQLLQTPFAAGFFGLGGGELIWVFVILIFLFGAAKLPALAKGLGQSVKEFKKAQNTDDPPAKPEAPEPAVAKRTADAGAGKHGSN